MPLASIIVTCKNRLAHLKQTLGKLESQADAEVIVVDYGCQQGTRNWVRQACPSVKVVCVDDDPHFSLSRARNQGARHAVGQYLVFTDADVHVEFPICEWINKNRGPGRFWSVDPRKDPSLCGSAIIGRSDFEAAGGYDEAFRGWGWEDTDLYLRLEQQNLAHMHIPSTGFSAIAHDDTLRQIAVEKGGPGSKRAAYATGELYTHIKRDVFHQTRRQLGLPERVAMMERVRSFVAAQTTDSPQTQRPSFTVSVNTGRSGAITKVNLTYFLRT